MNEYGFPMVFQSYRLTNNDSRPTSPSQATSSGLVVEAYQPQW